MPTWLIWVAAAAVFTVGEVVTFGFFLGPIAVAALLTGLVALAGAGVVIQLLVFITASAASLLLLRPIAVRHLQTPRAIRTGTSALLGARAVVLERVDDNGGRVKIGGEVWSARPFFDGHAIEAGARVEVGKIEGATALVYE